MLRALRRTAIGLAVSAAIAYFLDPNLGRERRALARERLASLLRTTRTRTTAGE